MRIASLARSPASACDSVLAFTIGADAAEIEQLHLHPQDRLHDRGGFGAVRGDAEHAPAPARDSGMVLALRAKTPPPALISDAV